MITPSSTPTPRVFPSGSAGNTPKAQKSDSPCCLWIAPPVAAASFAGDTAPPGQLLPLATCIRLDLEDLPRFAVVDHQFADWGVRFRNAVAIHPSNPAYPPHSGMMVLIGAPKSGWLEATFRQPVRYVSGYVTSSRRTILRAFDRQGQLIAQTSSPEANLAGFHRCAPNLKLSIETAGIYRITFDSSNGELTLDDFEFYRD